jgi:hypothetical protein
MSSTGGVPRVTAIPPAAEPQRLTAAAAPIALLPVTEIAAVTVLPRASLPVTREVSRAARAAGLGASVSRLSEAVLKMLEELDAFNPPAPPVLVAETPPPKSVVSIVTVKEKPVGLGDRRGDELRMGSPVVALKGLRLESTVRFELWSSHLHTTTVSDGGTGTIQVTGVEEAADAVWKKIFEERAKLTAAGFLELELRDISISEAVASKDFGADPKWRKNLTFDVLFEYHYKDTDDSLGIITEIRALIDDGLDQHLVIRGELTRWGDTAPPLLLRGSRTIEVLSAFGTLGATGVAKTVTVRRTFDGGTPKVYASWATFLAEVSGSPPIERAGEIVFATVGDFLDALGPPGAADPGLNVVDAGGNVTPGDFRIWELELPHPVRLREFADRFEVVFGDTTLGAADVLYLRAGRSPKGI